MLAAYADSQSIFPPQLGLSVLRPILWCQLSSASNVCLQPRAWDAHTAGATAGHAADRAAYLVAQGRPQAASGPVPMQQRPAPNVQQQARDRAAPDALQPTGKRPAAAPQQHQAGDRAAPDAQQQTVERSAPPAEQRPGSFKQERAGRRPGSCEQESAGQQQLQAGGHRRQETHQSMQPRREPAAAAGRDKSCSEAEGRGAEEPADEPGTADEGDAADEPEEPAAAALADAGLPSAASAQTGPTSGGLAVTSGATAARTSQLLHVTLCRTPVRPLKQAHIDVPVCCCTLPARTSVSGDWLQAAPALSSRLQCVQCLVARASLQPGHLHVPELTAAQPVVLHTCAAQTLLSLAVRFKNM